MESEPNRADQFNKVAPLSASAVSKENLTKNSTRGHLSKALFNDFNCGCVINNESSLAHDITTSTRFRRYNRKKKYRQQQPLLSPPITRLSRQETSWPHLFRKRSWIIFGKSTHSSMPSSMSEKMVLESYHDYNPSESLLEQCENAGKGNSPRRRISREDLLNAVDRTVSVIKGNIFKLSEDEVNLMIDDVDSSNTSGEVIYPDRKSEAEGLSLRDFLTEKYTSDLDFPDASSAVTPEYLKFEKCNERRKENNLVETCKVLDDHPADNKTITWKFWYRFPDQKKLMGARSWVPVSVAVEANAIRITDHINATDIVKVILLHPFLLFSTPSLHPGDREGKMNSVKLQHVKYSERRKLRRGKWVIEHMPLYSTVAKLACRDALALKEFIRLVESSIRFLPIHRDKVITYEYEEILIDSCDECHFMMSGDGHIIQYNITVQMRMRVLISGNPELNLVINDIKNKEILFKIGNPLWRVNKPSNYWISPHHLVYHPCVDEVRSQCEEGIMFSPPDGCSFELLRFNVHRKETLPLICRSSLEIISNKSIHLRATIQVKGDAKTIRYKRNDVKLYIPVPKSWGNLFAIGKSIKGVKQYLRVKNSAKSSISKTKSNTNVTIKVSSGKATYEPAFGAILWKLGTLPFLHENVSADAIHSFQCYLEHPVALPGTFEPISYVEFNIARPFESGIFVEEVLFSNGKSTNKRVSYRSNYLYRISMQLLGQEKK